MEFAKLGKYEWAISDNTGVKWQGTQRSKNPNPQTRIKSRFRQRTF
jgi:hypothetical protein